MPLVTRFDTPASLRDFPAGSPFYDTWHAYLAGAIARVTPGSGGGEFFNPSLVNVNPIAAHSLTWMGFPRHLLIFQHRDDRAAAFSAGENRDVQEEYCEWHVTRNVGGKITKIVVVTETPDYWRRVATTDRAVLVALYRSLVSPAVVEADLFSGGSYNPRNRWNTTDGIVHFIQGINTLDAALGLSQGSVNSAPARDNYEAFPTETTSVDPRVRLDIGTLARKGLSITLAEPIGLYIAGWNDDGWIKPDGSPVDNYWRVVRGAPPRVLRLEYEVPAGRGFVVGDIRIGGRPIEWGGQVAEHITCTVRGLAGRRVR